METLNKAPSYVATKYIGAKLVFSFDWVDFATSLTASSWAVPAGLVLENEDTAGTVATVEISGGTGDSWYTLVNTVTNQDGQVDQRILSVFVKNAVPENPLVTTTMPKYTSYDEIRAVLSVTDEELEDSVLALPNFETQLFEQMREVAVPLQQLYLDTLVVVNPSAAEKRFLRLTRVFSTYGVAVQLLDSLELLAVKSDQDARAKYERFEKPFERVEASTRTAFEVAKRRLADAYNEIASTPINLPAAEIPMFIGVGLATDPVTG